MFDRKTKELANAHDAVDRLQELKDDLKETQERKERIHDIVVRTILFLLIAGWVIYAFKAL